MPIIEASKVLHSLTKNCLPHKWISYKMVVDAQLFILWHIRKKLFGAFIYLWFQKSEHQSVMPIINVSEVLQALKIYCLRRKQILPHHVANQEKFSSWHLYDFYFRNLEGQQICQVIVGYPVYSVNHHVTGAYFFIDNCEG